MVRTAMDGTNGLWDDALGNVQTQLSGTAQWTVEAFRDTSILLPFLIYDQADFFQGVIQFPHRRKKAATTEIHLHYIPMAAGNGNVVLTYAYAFCGIGDTFPANTSWTTADATIPIVSADVYKHKYTSLVSNIAVPTTDSVSPIMIMKFTNKTGAGGTTYTTSKDHGTAKANFGVLYLDCHFQADSLGSELEHTKF